MISPTYMVSRSVLHSTNNNLQLHIYSLVSEVKDSALFTAVFAVSRPYL